MLHIDKALAVVIERGARETAQRICSILINIFEYTDLRGFLENPITINRLKRYRKEMSKPVAKRHLYKDMSEKEISLLLKALKDFKGSCGTAFGNKALFRSQQIRVSFPLKT